MSTLRIAICEDNEEDAQRLIFLASAAHNDSEITVFPDARTFVTEYRPGCWDLVFADIYMPDGSKGERAVGLDVVGALRRVDPLVPVVFTTTSPEFALEGFRLDADQYLIKPVESRDVKRVVDSALRAKEMLPGVLVRANRQDVNLSPQRIMYAGQDGHYCTVHLTDGNLLETRMKLDELEEAILSLDRRRMQEQFYRSHKSYLVNLSFVEGIDPNGKFLVMADGGHATIRRGMGKRAKEAWEGWMFETTRRKDRGFGNPLGRR